MKRVGYLYEKLIDVDNCKRAIINASKGKHSRNHVKHILDNVDKYAEDLSNRFKEKDFTSPYRTKIIEDGLSHKRREIQVPKFYPDQCAHHAIVQIIQPIIIKSSYAYSCANIKGRGISKAAKYMSKNTRYGKARFCSKFDISKFYPSVDNNELKKKFRTKFKDEKFLEIIDIIIDTAKGLPIGNYTSPWFAEFFLQDLDRYIKQDLKIKYYVRYADDLVLMERYPRKLKASELNIKHFLMYKKLTLKPNYQTFPIYYHGRWRKIDFIGRCYGIGVCTIRKRVARAIMRQSRFIAKLQREGKTIYFKNAAGFISRASAFQYTDSYAMKVKYYYSIDINQLKDVIRQESKRRESK